MELGLRGKVAVVTGASRGIGKAVAHALSQEGCAVAICGRNAARLDAAVGELAQGGARVLGVAADVTDEAAVRRFVDSALETFGRIDILVNNAGTHLRGTVESTTLAILEQQLRDKLSDSSRCPRRAAGDETPARRTDRQHRRAGGAPSAPGPVSVRRHQCGAAGDDQVGRRRGGAR
jgi:NAD(P)-dependent dehydrogenase (short-subunit alcohol dehydrogenase family)